MTYDAVKRHVTRNDPIAFQFAGGVLQTRKVKTEYRTQCHHHPFPHHSSLHKLFPTPSIVPRIVTCPISHVLFFLFYLRVYALFFRCGMLVQFEKRCHTAGSVARGNSLPDSFLSPVTHVRAHITIVYLYIYIYIYIYLSLSIYLYIYISLSLYICMCMCMRVCVCVCVCSLSLYKLVCAVIFVAPVHCMTSSRLEQIAHKCGGHVAAF